MHAKRADSAGHGSLIIGSGEMGAGMLGDIKSKKLILIKGFLFLIVGVLALAILYLESQSIRVMVLTAIAIWAFCRFYYFMFYCIEMYVDPSYKFAGLGSFLAYVLRRRYGEGKSQASSRGSLSDRAEPSLPVDEP